MTRTLLLAATILFSGVLLTTAVVSGQHPNHPQSAPSAAAVKPAVPAPPGALPPLPRGYQPVRPMTVVQQVYEFAARHPEVLQFVPCYCGCERGGHKGNHDCFVKSRAANGRITEWDAHGMGCAVCVDVGYRAMNLFNAGTSVSAIRAAIDREFGTRYPSSTPTPQPPKSTKKG